MADPILPEDTTVELQPHYAEREVAGVMTKVKLPQSVIMINGQWGGYVADAPGSQVNVIIPLSDEVREVVKSKVDELRGSESPRLTQIVELNENNVKIVEEASQENGLKELDNHG